MINKHYSEEEEKNKELCFDAVSDSIKLNGSIWFDDEALFEYFPRRSAQIELWGMWTIIETKRNFFLSFSVLNIFIIVRWKHALSINCIKENWSQINHKFYDLSVEMVLVDMH